MNKFYAYGDDGQMHIEASSIEEAAKKAGIPTAAEADDGGWLIVRNEETMETIRFGMVPEGHG